jgi:hypothetical protein
MDPNVRRGHRLYHESPHNPQFRPTDESVYEYDASFEALADLLLGG